MAEGERPRLRDYAKPGIQESTSGIRNPTMDANNFELKPTFISMVQQLQFGGSPVEDPNMHLTIFLEVCDTLKMNGVTSDAIRLQLFPFSLRDKARAWLHSLPASSITTWDQLSRSFLAKYFPPSKTANLRNQISTFTHKDDETLYEAWERYKQLLRLCPHHGLPSWMVLHNFYNGLLQSMRTLIDVAAEGAILNKTYVDAYNLIKEMALNHYQWSNERGATKCTPGKYDVDALTILSAKVDAMTYRLDRLNVNYVNASSSTSACEICGSGSDQVHAINNLPQIPQFDPQSNTYNQGWRNHPNFSWRNNQNPPFQ
ncbi:hypothetical protein K2173_010936 [Erythroxylum novogranatense]|uniref:Retrotransposon gag domain-containing protein n=1 Tax=Erythroxylum novogranatense TaxID=1862640 RepID=A0AAV8T1F8_9ROSI|nr:hypothetical protein K2173_010936 [Erythroxylum novogranatense]